MKNGYKFHKLIENSKIEVIPEAGHLAIEEKHNTANELIKEFINDV